MIGIPGFQLLKGIKLFGFKINPIKIRLNATIAMSVVNGNHFTWKEGLTLYCGLSFKWAAQIPIQTIIIVNPGIVIR
jgi:xanthine/uracil/vitamin C permease (AzgA family)